MLPDLQFSILCDDVRREDNGKFILLGLFEVIGAPQFPATHPTLFIVNRWCNGEGKFTQRTRIVSPANALIIEDKEIDFSLADILVNHTIISRFNNITFPQPGRYWVEVLLSGELKQRYPVVLVERKAA